MTKHAGGRPPLYKTPEDMQKIIDEYFEWSDNRTKKVWDDKAQKEFMISDPAPYTMSGLARRLGMERNTLIEYAHKDKFISTIKKARERVHEDVEIRLMEGKNQTGAIFNLKNNFNWKDAKQYEHEGSIDLGVKEEVKFLADILLKIYETRPNNKSGDKNSS